MKCATVGTATLNSKNIKIFISTLRKCEFVTSLLMTFCMVFSFGIFKQCSSIFAMEIKLS